MTTNDDDGNWFSEVIAPASGSKPPITSQKKKKKWGRQNIISHQKGFAKFHSRLPVQGTRISRGTAQRQLWDVVAATLSFASQAKDVRWELIMVIAPNLLPAPLHYNPWSASNPRTLDQSVSNEGHAISSWHGCNARKLNYVIGNFCRAETGTWTEWLVAVSLPLLRIYGPRSFPSNTIRLCHKLWYWWTFVCGLRFSAHPASMTSSLVHHYYTIAFPRDGVV